MTITQQIINYSVGTGGRNNEWDVRRIQKLMRMNRHVALDVRDTGIWDVESQAALTRFGVERLCDNNLVLVGQRSEALRTLAYDAGIVVQRSWPTYSRADGFTRMHHSIVSGGARWKHTNTVVDVLFGSEPYLV